MIKKSTEKVQKIFCIPGATMLEIKRFQELLENNKDNENIFINSNAQLYVVKGDEVFEVVNDLKKIGVIKE